MNGIKKSSLLAVVLVMVGVLFLAGCDEKDPLLATWEEQDSGITMQFMEDGSLVISNQKTSLTVSYEKQDPNLIVVKASADGSYPGQTMLYRIEEDRLILTVDHVESVFRLVK